LDLSKLSLLSAFKGSGFCKSESLSPFNFLIELDHLMTEKPGPFSQFPRRQSGSISRRTGGAEEC
jgi:hypothetical protein